METLEKRLSKPERILASKSYHALSSVLENLTSEKTEIEIEETKDKIVVPVKALKLLNDVLKAMGQGKIVSLVPMATEVTTQKAAEILGCSRPHLIKLLQEEKIPFTKVGRHRRIKFEDVMEYKNKTKEEQKQHLIDLMKFDESQGMYDS